MAIVRTNHAGASAGGHTLADVALDGAAIVSSDAPSVTSAETESGDAVAAIASNAAENAHPADLNSSLSAQHFQRLLAGLATHQDWAITQLYHTWAARAEALARAIIPHDESAASDVVQAAFMRVIQSPPKALPDAEAMDRWMARAVVSSAIDHLRREASQRRRIAVAAGAPAATGLDNEASTDRDIAEQITDLQSRLQALDDRDRELIALHHGRGMTLAAIAATLGQTLGSVHGRLRRAMEKTQSDGTGSQRQCQ